MTEIYGRKLRTHSVGGAGNNMCGDGDPLYCGDVNIKLIKSVADEYFYRKSRERIILETRIKNLQRRLFRKFPEKRESYSDYLLRVYRKLRSVDAWERSPVLIRAVNRYERLLDLEKTSLDDYF